MYIPPIPSRFFTGYWFVKNDESKAEMPNNVIAPDKEVKDIFNEPLAADRIVYKPNTNKAVMKTIKCFEAEKKLSNIGRTKTGATMSPISNTIKADCEKNDGFVFFLGTAFSIVIL